MTARPANLTSDVRGPGPVLEHLVVELRDPSRQSEPRHSQLRSAVLETLAKGYWAPGDKLPSETEIARVVGFSLGTVQKALARLASEGVLTRRHGHGTFVSGGGDQFNQLIHFRFLAKDGLSFLPVYAEATDRRVIKEKGPWSSFLGGSSGYIRIRRNISVGDEINCLSEFYIEAKRFSPLLDIPLEDLHKVVIRNILANQFNAPTFALTQRAYSMRFPEYVRDALKLPKKDNFGMVIEVFSFSHGNAPISFQSIFIPHSCQPIELVTPWAPK